MKLSKSFFVVTLFIGIVFLLLGVYLELSGQMSDGYSTTKFGGSVYGVVNGFVAVFLGIFMLLMSAFAFWIYKSDNKKKYKK